MELQKSARIKTPADVSREMIADVAAQHDLSYRDIVGYDARDVVMRARRAAIRAVVQAKPHLSMPQVGRLFQRDHTTIMHHLGRRARFTGAAAE